MMDLNKFYEDFRKDPFNTRINLIQTAISTIQNDIIDYNHTPNHIWDPEKGIFDSDALIELLKNPDYEEYLDILQWPNFEDNGIFYECIKIACDTLLQAYRIKPLNYLSEHENLENK